MSAGRLSRSIRRAFGMSKPSARSPRVLRRFPVIEPALDQPRLQNLPWRPQMKAPRPAARQIPPARRVEQQVIPLDHQPVPIRPDDLRSGDRGVARPVENRQDHLAASGQPPEGRGEPREVERLRRALAFKLPALDEHAVVEMIPVHRHQSGRPAGLVEQPHDVRRDRRLARSRRSGDGDQMPRAGRRQIGQRIDDDTGGLACRAQAATVAAGGSLAPVINATASDIV